MPLPITSLINRIIDWWKKKIFEPLDILCRRAGVVLVVVVALAFLLWGMGESREVMQGVLDTIADANIEVSGSDMRRKVLEWGLGQYAAIYISALMLAASVWIATLALGGVYRTNSPQPAVWPCAVGLGLATLTIIHCALLHSFGLLHLEVWIVQLVCLGIALMAIWLLPKKSGVDPRFVAWVLGLIQLALLTFLALDAWHESRVAFWYWISWYFPEWSSINQSPSWTTLSLPIILSGITPSLALFGFWLGYVRRSATDRIDRLPVSVGHLAAREREWGIRRLLYVTLLFAVMFFVLMALLFTQWGAWGARYVVQVGSVTVVLTWLAWIVCALSCIALICRLSRLPGLLLVIVIAMAYWFGYPEKLGTEELPVAQDSANTAVSLIDPQMPRVFSKWFRDDTTRLANTDIDVSPIDPQIQRVLSNWFRDDTTRLAIIADGGGLRAAAYTADVLARADDLTCGEFGRRVFAASGVSGGSLGIATWAVMRQAYVQSKRDPKEHPWQTCLDKVSRQISSSKTPGEQADWSIPVQQGKDLELTGMVLVTLEQDYLSVPLLGMLTRDLFKPGRTAERGQYLLNGWQAVAQEFTGTTAFATRLSEVSAGISWQPPLLLFSATNVASGEPFVFSNDQRLSWVDTNSVSIGAAVLNSARFPFITPAGRWINPVTGKDSYHLVDGGFFDNTGAATLATALEFKMNEDKKTFPKRLVVLRINGNPEFDGDAERCKQRLDAMRQAWEKRNKEVPHEDTANAKTPGSPPALADAAEVSAQTDDAFVHQGWSAYQAFVTARAAHGQEEISKVLVAPEKKPPSKWNIDQSITFIMTTPMRLFDQTCLNGSDGTATDECIKKNASLCDAAKIDERVALGWYLALGSGKRIDQLANSSVSNKPGLLSMIHDCTYCLPKSKKSKARQPG